MWNRTEGKTSSAGSLIYVHAARLKGRARFLWKAAETIFRACGTNRARAGTEGKRIGISREENGPFKSKELLMKQTGRRSTLDQQSIPVPGDYGVHFLLVRRGRRTAKRRAIAVTAETAFEAHPWLGLNLAGIYDTGERKSQPFCLGSQHVTVKDLSI
jgi:hypothetical protein